VVAAIEKIEQKVGAGTFKYTLYMDPGVSGRLEATVYLNSGGSDAGDGIVLHSKANSKKYIHQDYDTFLQLLEDALKA
jgi:hypothetical protein